MKDFTVKKFEEILRSFTESGYSFQTFNDFLKDPDYKAVVLRHDVDRSPENSLATARLENTLGIAGSYYFRIVKVSNRPEIIRAIAQLGHEIGYHYEDLSLSSGDTEKALETFSLNLEYFRGYYPVSTICMHGSPSSRWDNRLLWQKYDYHDFELAGEPYFDIDFNKVLYLTDTGRRWDGDRWSVRDKVTQEGFGHLKERIHSSDDLLALILNNELPHRIMITTHPQRWNDDGVQWLKEYGMQCLKNLVKKYFFVRN